MKPPLQRCQVLLVGPLPTPPFLGGVEVGVDLLLNSELAEQTGMRLFNNWRGRDSSRPIWQRLSYQLAAYARFVLIVLQSRCRIVHVKTSSGVNFYQNGLYAFIARLLGRRVILQIHGGGFPDYYQQSSRLRQAIVRRLLNFPQVLLVLSPWWADYFNKLTGREAMVAPNATYTRIYSQAQPDRKRFGIPPGRIAILFMGTRDRATEAAKGIFELLDAMADLCQRYPQLFLVVAGNGSHRKEIEQVLGKEGKCWLSAGVITLDVKPELYQSIDLFVLPSHYENMPNSLIEAMAAGVPAIATAVGAIPEMIQDGVSGFVIPSQDAQALAARIECLITDATLYKSIAAAAAQAAAEKYDMAVLQQILLDVYKKVSPGIVTNLTKINRSGKD